MTTAIHEFMRECPAARRLPSGDVLQVPADLFIGRRPPEQVRADEPAFVATVACGRPRIAPGRPWEGGYNEGLNGGGSRP